MNRALLALMVAAALLPACAASRNSSDAAWARGQCEQINDEDARKKCHARADDQYGRR
jgi:carbohydrate-selective porin OprB